MLFWGPKHTLSCLLGNQNACKSALLGARLTLTCLLGAKTQAKGPFSSAPALKVLAHYYSDKFRAILCLYVVFLIPYFDFGLWLSALFALLNFGRVSALFTQLHVFISHSLNINKEFSQRCWVTSVFKPSLGILHLPSFIVVLIQKKKKSILANT